MLCKEDFKLREDIRDSIENLVKELNQDFKVFLYGSSVNGVGFKGTDIDVFVDFENGQDCNQYEILESISKKFKENLEEFNNIEEILSARIPIIKFVHVKSGLKCDLSISNRLALMNSKFIKKCLEIDSR